MKTRSIKGFSLLEVIVVLGVISIMAFFSIPSFMNYRDTGTVEGEKLVMMDIRLNAEKYIAFHNKVPTFQELLDEFYAGGELFPFSDYLYVKIVDYGEAVVDDIDLLSPEESLPSFPVKTMAQIGTFGSLDHLFLQSLITLILPQGNSPNTGDVCRWDYNHGHGNDPYKCDCDNPGLIKQCTDGKYVGKARVCCDYCCNELSACNFPYCNNLSVPTPEEDTPAVTPAVIVGPNAYFALRCNHQHRSLNKDSLVVLRYTDPMAWHEVSETLSQEDRSLVANALGFNQQ